MESRNNKMTICESAFEDVINFIVAQGAESGGALFGSEKDYVIQKFVPDKFAQTTGGTYTINADYLNKIINKLWEEQQLSLIGIIHSHPQGSKTLSKPDLEYFGELLNSMKRKKFITPIVHTIPDGKYKLHPYVLNSNGSEIKKAQLDIVPDDYKAEKRELTIDEESDNLLNISGKVVQIAKDVVIIEGLALTALALGFAGWSIIKVAPPLIQFLTNLLTP